MGAYITQSDLTPALVSLRDLIQVTQDDPEVDEVDATALADVIEESEAEVDGYLGTRHALPLATVPTLVRKVAARVCRYRLLQRRPGMVTDQVQADYDAAIKLLGKIASGTVSLGIQPEPVANSETVIKVVAPERVFTLGKLGGF